MIKQFQQKCCDLRTVIESSSGEREIHRQLEANPWVVVRLFERNYGGFVISHFWLGDELEADFVVLTAYSGGWFVHLLELEPPELLPFNKVGDYSPRLNHAAGQIRRWKLFIDRPDKKAYLISQLARAAQSRDLLWRDGRQPKCSANWNFDDPRSIHSFYFHVLMGRRKHLKDSLMSRKAALLQTDGFQLITYDRVIEWTQIIESDLSYSPDPV